MYAIKIILGYRCERTRLKKERRFELQIHSNLSSTIFISTQFNTTLSLQFQVLKTTKNTVHIQYREYVSCWSIRDKGKRGLTSTIKKVKWSTLICYCCIDNQDIINYFNKQIIALFIDFIQLAFLSFYIPSIFCICLKVLDPVV